jgi:hypothetical protein
MPHVCNPLVLFLTRGAGGESIYGGKFDGAFFLPVCFWCRQLLMS